ncbi:hypothetical protein RUM44_003805 [Polyplax serrata]|uniref:Integrator complex subunit 12 n=1 Tax=Polyplax serrata TaxID=468196 RepID=A0ABR1B103_POLSC
MTSFEMEPAFCKALKLLHSNANDSSDEIMHLLEEVIQQKYGGTKTLNLKCGNFYEEPAKPVEPPKMTRLSRGSSPALSATAGQTSEKSSRDSSPPSEPVSTRTTPDLDDGDLALEIFEDDLNCKICKGMTVGPRNRLVECSDCHSLYHQECHKPPISENVNDPRLVWYCSSCTKKTQEKVQPKVKSVQLENNNKKLKPEVVSENKSSAFKRNEKNSSSSHNKNPSGSGMANLAASFQADQTSSKSKISSKSASASSSSSKHHSSSNSNSKSTTSLNYSKTPSSPNQKSQSGPAPAPANIIAADKRLQNMKKKAAAKMQEKRSKHK